MRHGIDGASSKGEAVSNRWIVHALGRCIYCGTTDAPLSKEHVIPKGLGGTLVLPKASCAGCAKITSAVECQILRKYLINVRSRLGLPSYKQQNQPGPVSIEFRRGERSETVDVPIRLATAMMVMPRLAPPGYFGGR